MASAFKMAYASQREKSAEKEHCTKSPSTDVVGTSPGTSTMMSHTSPSKQPTFNELIEKQIVQQRQKNEEYDRQQQEALAKRLSEISTAKIDERVKERRERRQREIDALEREREQQRLQGKDRITWVGQGERSRGHSDNPYWFLMLGLVVGCSS